MPVLTPERAEEVAAGWRLGIDENGLESPAGPLFADGYTELEITMTGSSTGDGYSVGGTCESSSAIISCFYECC
jgi:hypothetical protein